MLCVTAQVVANQSTPSPNGTVTYSVWIWSTAPAQKVTATIASSSRLTRTPRFTLCPVVFGTKCSVGSLPAGQAFELMVTDHIRATATAGSSITLTVVVQGAGLSPAEATSTTVVGQASPSPSPSPSTSVTPLPSGFPFVPSATTITPGSLTNLFPVVTPTASPSGSSSHLISRGRPQILGLTSSSLPLDPRLIGGQLAALAVLAAAVTMVVARLSLRTPQPAAPGTTFAPEAESGDDAKTEG